MVPTWYLFRAVSTLGVVVPKMWTMVATLKYGMFAWYGFAGPQRDKLKRIHEAGFPSVMLWWGDELAFGEHEKSDLVQLTRDIGLEIENIHVPYIEANKLWSDEAQVREPVLQKHIGWLQNCANFAVPMMVMHISRGELQTAPNEHGMDSFSRLVREAERLRVTLAIENTRTVNLTKHLLRSFPSASLGFCYDTSHGRLYESEPFELVKAFPNRLKCLHLSDNDDKSDRHWIVGRGVVDWDAFARAFPKDYCGCLSLEVEPNDEKETESAFLQAAHAALAEVGEKISRARREV